MKLIAEKQFTVRFNEVDALGIVWHGSYASYFEDAREAFGLQFGLDYLTLHEKGYYVPLVNLTFSYKKPLTYGESAIVIIEYIPTEANKLIFEYKIVSLDRKTLIATGRSEQVFLSRDKMELVLYPPEFYTQWKQMMFGK